MAGCDARHIYDIDRKAWCQARTPTKAASAQGNRRGAKPRLQAGGKRGKVAQASSRTGCRRACSSAGQRMFSRGSRNRKTFTSQRRADWRSRSAACRKRDPFISSESNLTTLADDAPYVRYGAQRSAPWQTNFRSKETLPLPHAAEVTTKEINRESS